jgi:hypothetical protein
LLAAWSAHCNKLLKHFSRLEPCISEHFDQRRKKQLLLLLLLLQMQVVLIILRFVMFTRFFFSKMFAWHFGKKNIASETCSD